jgi:hypothetical protein
VDTENTPGFPEKMAYVIAGQRVGLLRIAIEKGAGRYPLCYLCDSPLSLSPESQLELIEKGRAGYTPVTICIGHVGAVVEHANGTGRPVYIRKVVTE